jgi:hypothetical protein
MLTGWRNEKDRKIRHYKRMYRGKRVKERSCAVHSTLCDQTRSDGARVDRGMLLLAKEREISGTGEEGERGRPRKKPRCYYMGFLMSPIQYLKSKIFTIRQVE